MDWYSFILGFILGIAVLATTLLIVENISDNKEMHKRLLELDRKELHKYKELYENAKHIIEKYSDTMQAYNEIIAEHNKNKGARRCQLKNIKLMN